MKMVGLTIERKRGKYIVNAFTRLPWHRKVKTQAAICERFEDATACVAVLAQGAYSISRTDKEPEWVEDIRPIMKGGIG